MTLVFACKSVHFKDDFFRATQLEHSLSEPRVTDKSIVNVLVFSFFLQVSTIQRNIHKQFYNSLTDTPLNKLSSFHNPLHTLVRTSCSQAVKHMRLRIAAFVFLLPED